MKRPIKTIMIGAVAMLLAATSCQKEETPKVQTGDTISISIQGAIGDFTPADGVKATAEPVIRVMWAENDPVYVYDGTEKLGKLKVTLKDGDARYAYLTNDGEIAAPQGSIITLVYSNTGEPSFTDGGILTVDISTQNQNDFPFVLYATLPATQTVTDKFVPFKFATSVMKVSGTGIGTGTGITETSIGQVNTVCQLTIDNDAEPTVAGITPGTITRTKKISESDDGRATFTIGMVGTETGSGREVSIKKGGKTYVADFTQSKIETGASYNSVYAFTEKIILPYVVIPAKYNGETVTDLKWYRQNLAISPSGNKSWKGKNETAAVKVPGTNDDVINGDYFQWAASYTGYNIAADADKKPENLLIYTSFTSKMTNGSEATDAFEFKSPETGKKYMFSTSDSGDNIGISPYYDKTATAYGKYTSGSVNLEKEDDVANIILGGNWRMPTKAEFMAMRDATYWAWDATDCGYYVFMPGQGTEGSAGGRGTIAGTDHKDQAVLFFPLAGNGNFSHFYVGSNAYYWSSSLVSSNADYAWYLTFYSGFVEFRGTNRYSGYSVRPVSD